MLGARAASPMTPATSTAARRSGLWDLEKSPLDPKVNSEGADEEAPLVRAGGGGAADAALAGCAGAAAAPAGIDGAVAAALARGASAAAALAWIGGAAAALAGRQLAHD